MNAVVKWSTSMVLVFAVGTTGPVGTISADTFLITEAVAADWTEGSLIEIRGMDKASEHNGRSGRRPIALDKVELVMQGGPTLRLAPSVRVLRDGSVIPLEELPAQSRIRYSPVKGLVTEIVLLDLLAR